jgi:hypothetical protein
MRDAKALLASFNTDKTLELKKPNLRRSDVCMPFIGTGLTDATGTMDASAGVVEWLENLSNKFWRRRRYSSSLYPKSNQIKSNHQSRQNLP